jgi:hypothetical protein
MFDKCTSDAVAHGVKLLPSHSMALSPRRAMGRGGRSLFPAPARVARRHDPAAEWHDSRHLTPCHTAARLLF